MFSPSVNATTSKVGVLLVFMALLLWGGRASLSPPVPPPAVSPSGAPTGQLQGFDPPASSPAPDAGTAGPADRRSVGRGSGVTELCVQVVCEAGRDLQGLRLVLLKGLGVVAGAAWEAGGPSYLSAPGPGTFHVGVVADSLPEWAELLPLGEGSVHVWGSYLVPGSVELIEGEQSSVTMTVTPRGEVEVLVLDAAGYPLAGVTIVLVAGRAWGVQERLLSDSSGLASASDVSPGEHLVRAVSPVGDHAFVPQWIQVEGGRPTVATLSLEPATSSVAGGVVGGTGEPLPGVLVEWHSSGVGRARHRERTGPGGGFRFSGLVSGDGQVVIPRQALEPTEDGRAVDILERVTAPSVALGPHAEVHVGSLAVATRDDPTIFVQLGGVLGADLELMVSSPMPEGATRLDARRRASRRVKVKGGDGVHLRRPGPGTEAELTLWEEDVLIARLQVDGASSGELILQGP